MTLFEYLVIALALLFTAAAMRLIGGLPSALDRDSRYSIHAGWGCLMPIGIAVGFWNLWSVSEMTWTLPTILPRSPSPEPTVASRRS